MMGQQLYRGSGAGQEGGAGTPLHGWLVWGWGCDDGGKNGGGVIDMDEGGVTGASQTGATAWRTGVDAHVSSL
jgi:hypothetical protein